MPLTNAENHWNILKICLFGQATKQQATLSPENLENTSNSEGWDLILVAFRQRCKVISHVLYQKNFHFSTDIFTLPCFIDYNHGQNI